MINYPENELPAMLASQSRLREVWLPKEPGRNGGNGGPKLARSAGSESSKWLEVGSWNQWLMVSGQWLARQPAACQRCLLPGGKS